MQNTRELLVLARGRQFIYKLFKIAMFVTLFEGNIKTC